MSIFGPSKKQREFSARVDAAMARQREERAEAARKAEEEERQAARITRDHNRPTVWINPDWRPPR